MVHLGLKPRAPVLKVQPNPQSYGGTPTKVLSKNFLKVKAQKI